MNDKTKDILFLMIPYTVYLDSDLDAQDIAVYNALLVHRNKKTNLCNPSIRTLEKTCKNRVKRDKIESALKKLKAKKHIYYESAVGKKTHYNLLATEELEKELERISKEKSNKSSSTKEAIKKVIALKDIDNASKEKLKDQLRKIYCLIMYRAKTPELEEHSRKSLNELLKEPIDNIQLHTLKFALESSIDILNDPERCRTEQEQDLHVKYKNNKTEIRELTKKTKSGEYNITIGEWDK